MGFYKRVNLSGPSGEMLSGWIKEPCGQIGSVVQIQEDEDYGRNWTVTEAGPQLVVESQIQESHKLNAYFPKDYCREDIQGTVAREFPMPDAPTAIQRPRPPLKRKLSRIRSERFEE